MERVYIRDGRAPIPKRESTSRIMSSIRAKNTKPELKLRKALCDNGSSGYRLHWKNAPGRPDICYPGKKIAIFVNGCYWHRCPYCNPSFPKTHISFWENKFNNNIKRDKRKIKELKRLGWKVATIWECQINKKLDKVVLKIKKIVNQ